MKWATPALALSLMVGASGAEAAILGPNAGYTVGGVTYSFTDISVTGTSVLANVDDAAVTVAIGFDFGFYGSTFNSVFVSSNGLLSFNAANTGFTNLPLTGPFVGDRNQPTIAVLWDDWNTANDDPSQVYHQTVGAAGTRQFIVQWDQVYPFAQQPGPNRVTFQARLFEGSNNILFSYADVVTGTVNSLGGSGTVGIRNLNGDLNGQFVQWSDDEAVLRDETSILFTPVPEPATIVLTSLGLIAAYSGRRRRTRRD